MKGILALLLVIGISGCASNDLKKNAETANHEKSTETKKEGVHVFDVFSDVGGFKKEDLLTSYKDCKELLAQLRSKDIKIKSIKEKQVTITGENGWDLSYLFEAGGCLD
ncbi:hypothetical protein [Psychrobium sp. 1_MG-2023]|uniref:hypothetical protein n=1 Tax=Psychrobium sp. 1_MG-2023 TaxID=3062624 RepID=UPI000C336C13|nr:hypothetical protein [Psychrobium sp. 1_MG-2023]MDP2560605.1 hypothetical protein [Psychrobium sp. 1_MG-2023]PKF57591.1 hypothetical protein CW748_06815 [Alteromonadales bacterium alter-6D02]